MVSAPARSPPGAPVRIMLPVVEREIWLVGPAILPVAIVTASTKIAVPLSSVPREMEPEILKASTTPSSVTYSIKASSLVPKYNFVSSAICTLPLTIIVPETEELPLVLKDAPNTSPELETNEPFLIEPETPSCPLVSIPAPKRRPEPDKCWTNFKLPNLSMLRSANGISKAVCVGPVAPTFPSTKEPEL